MFVGPLQIVAVNYFLASIMDKKKRLDTGIGAPGKDKVVHFLGQQRKKDKASLPG